MRGKARLTVVLLFGTVLAGAAEAQTVVATPGPVRSPVFESFRPAVADTEPMRIKPTHWVTGAAIGGTALGLLTGLTAVGLCAMDDSGTDPSAVGCFAGGLLLGGLLGGTIGALIGGQFPKGDDLGRTPGGQVR